MKTAKLKKTAKQALYAPATYVAFGNFANFGCKFLHIASEPCKVCYIGTLWYIGQKRLACGPM
jgi:hypothetical protein